MQNNLLRLPIVPEDVASLQRTSSDAGLSRTMSAALSRHIGSGAFASSERTPFWRMLAKSVVKKIQRRVTQEAAN